MSIYENTRQMKELLAKVLSNDTQEIQENHLSSFATPKLYEKPLMESEDEQEFIVTEGWNEEDISELFENYSEDEIEDALNEGIFSGIHPKAVKDITKGFTDFRGGEHSPYESTTVNNKSKTHTAIANKLNNHHVIVKHNGKVIATLHPLDNAARSDFHANDADGKEHRVERTEKWRSRTYQRNGRRFGGDLNTRQYTDSRLTKGEAIEHAQNQIAKHGGFDGHNVELHFIGKDEERPKIAKERSNTRRMNRENPKTFENIAGRAADRVTGAKAKDVYGAKHYAREAHEHKKNLDKAFESGNHKHAAVYASELANSLNKAHELGSINRTYDQKRANWAATTLGQRKDDGHNNLTDHYNKQELASAIRKAKSGDSY
jgi:hypothetical protein